MGSIWPMICKELCQKLSPSVDVLTTMTMLLVHHQVVTGDQGWVAISKILVAMQDRGISFSSNTSVLFIAYQIILDVFNPREHLHGGLDINWLQTWALPDHILDLGLSPRLLFFIGRITELASEKNTREAMSLLGQIQGTDQIVSGVQGEATLVVERIALSYKHAAILMLYCRLFG